MNRFFVSSGEIEDKIVLKDDNYQHIKNVLRLSVGDKIVVCDGLENDYYCTISSFSGKGIVEVSVDNCEKNLNEPKNKIYLFQGLPKSDKIETIIQKAVEVGVHKIIPFETERSVARITAKKSEKTVRFAKISEAAAKQSHRGIIPSVSAPLSFNDALEEIKSIKSNLSIVAYEKETGNGIKECLKRMNGDNILILIIGSEGGFSEREIVAFESVGAVACSLGRRILRCETAGPIAIALILYALEG